MSSTVTTEAVTEAMDRVGYGHYASRAFGLTTALNRRGVSVDTVEAYLREQGVGHAVTSHDVASFVSTLLTGGTESVSITTGGTESALPIQPYSGFDREQAAEVIRAFIEEDYSEEEVDALLILAGLEDVPEDEPEPEDEVFEDEAPSWARSIIERLDSLTAFARDRGYQGR